MGTTSSTKQTEPCPCRVDAESLLQCGAEQLADGVSLRNVFKWLPRTVSELGGGPTRTLGIVFISISLLVPLVTS